ncbi:4-hydroxy-tetrahydrodipicolinate synthase [Fundicoccus ignavus]|uniref:4-hydroxy-tetrahydrodipicolinate synthase n=1 Tax=Fundicoccus ignavus TaxID=2664442 RepID=A0A6I2GHS5_9LACT|nr:4-hydroxy-tetrahydrodipicolinate synthase [Fundicoccus ignavus]MRI85402.1 4-hydroxy-tetrahydrodipicolinate synthase [Fundicoccus ignavus]MRJ47479.1 4-hydroxy-tetrahydrodipicolinate synthase [Fundicoccus ignavus]
MHIYEGSAVALVTPFDERTNEIDWTAFEELLDFHLDNLTDALVITGTTGESSTLTDGEQIELIKFAVDYVDGRVPIIAGTGINDTAHSIKLSQQAEMVGADALLIVTPYYNKTSTRGMLIHFKTIADSVNIPIILYHVPGRTGAVLTVDQVVELANHPNIVAIKDATGDLEYTRELRERLPEEFAIYSGNDDINLEMLKLGVNGFISVTANVLPRELHQQYELFANGQLDEAEALTERLAGINEALFLETNPIPVKYLVHEMGYIQNSYRLPLIEPSEEVKTELAQYDTLVSDYKKA